jgi:type IV secretory pathway TrbD component
MSLETVSPTPVKYAAPLYGLVAEFGAPEDLVRAAANARQAGYRKLDAFSPFPLEELPQALGLRPTRLPALVLAGGLAGAVLGYGFQYWASAIAYPLNVGGRPLHSWPAFIPATFELAILGAALAAVLGMLLRSGLPRPHHPLFGVPAFARATQDRFFLCIEAADPQFDAARMRQFLQAQGAASVEEVPA